MLGINAVRHTNYLGSVNSVTKLNEVFLHKDPPSYKRGALQGEGVLAVFNAHYDDNYLYSLNAQCCIIATLYHPHSQKGAVIHFDHNISQFIDQAIDNVLRWMGPEGEIEATLSGGVWLLGGQSIGAPVKSKLEQCGITPSWDQWSISECWAHNYGVVLDLQTGDVQCFEHSMGVIRDFLTPLLRNTRNSKRDNITLADIQKRADYFMDRAGNPALAEINGQIAYALGPTNRSHPTPTQKEIQNQAIKLYNVGRSK